MDMMPTCLVIDDDASLREVLAFALEDLFEVCTAATGAEGLTRLQNDPIPLVLLDLHLPDLDGVEVLQRITALDPHIAVVILTGDPDSPLVTQAMQQGAVDLLIKPWDIDTLRSQLWEILAHAQQR
jgi:DNA-binding NtrC family response regulator